MPRYLNPKNDYTFRRVFVEHEHLCISLLNSMLPLENPIVSLEYPTGALIPGIEVLRLSVLDVCCTDSEGRQFFVEMQMRWTDSFKCHVLLNTSKAYVVDMDRQKKYELLQPMYLLNFVNENDTFEKSPDMRDEYYHHYKTVNAKNTGKQIKGLELVFIELPKFKPQNRAEKKMHELWLRFLTEVDESVSEAPRELLENSDTREAVQCMVVGAYSDVQLRTYDKMRDNIMVERALLSDARAEGEAKGELNAATRIALNLLKMGISAEDIMQGTGLTMAEIQALQNK